jgi:hypothetical protein
MALFPINQRETTMAFHLKSRNPNDGDQDLSNQIRGPHQPNNALLYTKTGAAIAAKCRRVKQSDVNADSESPLPRVVTVKKGAGT